MIFLQGFIKFDQGISEKSVGQTFGGRKKDRRRRIIIRTIIAIAKQSGQHPIPLFWYLGFHGNAMKFDERNKKNKKSPFLYFQGNCAKFVLPVPIFFWLISFH
jgi:hypothetical protein